MEEEEVYQAEIQMVNKNLWRNFPWNQRDEIFREISDTKFSWNWFHEKDHKHTFEIVFIFIFQTATTGIELDINMIL